MSTQDAIAWIRDEVDPQGRQWEEFYRNRWQHDKVVRSTHGVNCTGGCTWNIHVKDGIVTWEMQGLDYREDRVVVDGKVVTSRGPGTALEFSLELVRILAGPDKARELAGAMLVP